jgi:hypothetical protein
MDTTGGKKKARKASEDMGKTFKEGLRNISVK